MPRVRPAVWVALLGAAYLLAFFVLQPRLGDGVLAFLLPPIVMAGWLFGVRTGLAAAAIGVGLTLALLQTIGGRHGFQPTQIPRIAMAFAIAGAAGWVGTLARRQRRLLDENARIAAELRASHQGLEHTIAERTAELVRANEARREAESRAATADRMAVVGTLTAGIAHEINNPLAVIVSNLDFIGESVPKMPAQAAEALVDAQRAAMRAAEIVRNMRVFIQANATDQAADVRQVIEATVRMIANEIRHRARLELAIDDTPPVALATAHLGQILLNLLVNAIHALPERAAEQNLIHISAKTMPGELVRIEVTDSGSGIPADVVHRIFDPFFTTKPIGVGTGLGLWVCHQIVTAAHGRIAVESTPGSGTVFTLELPVAQPVADPVTAARAAAPRRARMLVIDDDPAVGRAIGRMLLDRHDLLIMQDGPSALADIAGGQRFDVILCDLMMPAMNGMEVLRKLEELAPEQAARVIFMTGGAFTSHPRSPAGESASAPADAFVADPQHRCLEKPFVVERLESVIAEVMQSC